MMEKTAVACSFVIFDEYFIVVSLAVCSIMTLVVLGRRRAGHGHLPTWILGMYYSLLCLQLKISILSGDLGCMEPLFHHLFFPPLFSLVFGWPLGA